jgi:hypothetical protein
MTNNLKSRDKNLAYAVPARATQRKSSVHKSHPSSTRNILDSSNVNIIVEIINHYV